MFIVVDSLKIDYEDMMAKDPSLFYNCLLNPDHEHSLLNYRSAADENLLHIACKQNKFWLIIDLITLGCNKHHRCNNGYTPQEVAVVHGNFRCAEKLY